MTANLTKSLPKIPVPGPVATAARIYSRVMDDICRLHIGLLSAGVAFYGLLAIFPALTAVVSLWGLFADPDVVAMEVATFEPMLPEAAYQLIEAQVTSLAMGPKQTLGWATVVSTLAALWASRSGIAALVRGLNAAYEVRARRGIWPMALAMGLTLALVAVALVALAMVVLAPIALSLIPLGPYTGTALNIARWVVGLAMVLLGIALLYRFGPNRPPAGRPFFSAGAWLALGLWAVVAWGFSTYIENFGNYDKVYGSLGAVIALLMWFYLSAYVVMLGALLNVARERAAYPPEPDDVVDPALVPPVAPPSDPSLA